jgi:hypothetical protein
MSVTVSITRDTSGRLPPPVGRLHADDFGRSRLQR